MKPFKVAIAGLMTWVSVAALQAGDEGMIDCRGAIQKLRATGNKTGVLGTILIEGPEDKAVAHDKAMVTINDKTKIEKQVGKERKPAVFADLKVGQRVQAKFTGPVAESYPVQARAATILILAGK